ncbi:hypothetical protein PoB_001848200 [Plakobranchus ocellatus]|uniref:Uncharacterized protein n=1 Tax=Plakobranchus ocellatus TaxID=259542 RepID=A0AAV3ZBV9_9GAST|nr:hypothetical protein PoB_001848200 [Plakobranchus ocellatus]
MLVVHRASYKKGSLPKKCATTAPPFLRRVRKSLCRCQGVFEKLKANNIICFQRDPIITKRRQWESNPRDLSKKRLHAPSTTGEIKADVRATLLPNAMDFSKRLSLNNVARYVQTMKI